VNIDTTKILVVEDEEEIKNLISMYLVEEGFHVIWASNGKQACELTIKENPDLILLDILLPGQDGIEVCSQLRRHTNAPIIFVTCKKEDIDMILGLSIGGDDYITKPFSPRVLVARVKAHLRRGHIQTEKLTTQKILHYPGLYIDISSRSVFVNDIQITLTAKEFDILALLAKNPNRVFYTSQIFEKIWKTYVLDRDFKTVMVHMSNLRKKIEPQPSNPKYILTVRGIGYKFNGFAERLSS
jgi:DNA-binding response OmpR family regulator